MCFLVFVCSLLYLVSTHAFQHVFVCVCVCVCVLQCTLVLSTDFNYFEAVVMLFYGAWSHALFHMCFLLLFCEFRVALMDHVSVLVAVCVCVCVCVFARLMCFMDVLVFVFCVFGVVSYVFVCVLLALTWCGAFSDSCFNWIVHVLFTSRLAVVHRSCSVAFVECKFSYYVCQRKRSFIYTYFIWKVPFQFVAILCYMFSIVDSKRPESWSAWFKGVICLWLLI